MKQFTQILFLVLVIFASLGATGVLEKNSWARSENNLFPQSSLAKEPPSNLSSILLLLNGSQPITSIPGSSPVSGTVPLTVQFTTESSGPVTTWKWDFDGDLSWDWVGTSKENQAYTYNTVGSHTATLQVSDLHGNTDSALVVTRVDASTVPEISFFSDTPQLFKGQTALLSWMVTGATSASIDTGIGSVSDTGSLSILPDTTTSYTLTASSSSGTSTSSLEVRVADPDTDTLEAYITSPLDGETISTDSVTVTGIVNQSTANVWVNGEKVIFTGLHFSKDIDLIPGMNTIAASASWNGKSVTDSTYVTRSFTYTPQPDNSFGVQFEDYIPADSSVASYDNDLFSLVTGVVEDGQGDPIENVSVTILNHPEYGTAHTDNTGKFFLPVEGGATLTTVYQHDNYLTAHRNIDIPANDIVMVKPVTLITQDTEVSSVIFDGTPATVVTHKSSVTSDSYGDRTITTVFRGDNKAWEVDEYGQRVRELSSIETRSTEFSTPASMPSTLPPHSAFTYCAELSVDGVERIEFEQPVVTWVNNFLGFEVGSIVPVGFYNRDSGSWVSSKNGVVVRLLDTDNDGITDGLDSTGDGVANDLDGNSSTSNEVIGLTDATAYPPGDTFWRVEVSHFTPWDYNWPLSPPDDFITPNAEDPPHVDQRDNRPERNNHEKDFACSIEPISRILHEDVPIQGTEVRLHYASNRVPGYTYPIRVPASGPTIPPSLKNITVTLQVAGQVMEQIVSAAPNQTVDFKWDGKYSDGKLATGAVTAHISVGFTYDAVYGTPDASVQETFAQPGLEPTVVPAREEYIAWKHWDIEIVSSEKNSASNVFGSGWTLSNHHKMLTTAGSPILYKGDGTVLEDISNAVINTFAGGGSINVSYNAPPHGTLATEVSFGAIKGIVRDSKGNTYLASWSDSAAIYKVAPDGVISLLAGQGPSNSYNINGIPATEQRIGEPTALAVDTEDNIYFFDSHWSSRSIRKIDNNGIITHVMGNVDGENCRNNCTIEDDTLSDVRGMTIDAEGNIYITNKVGTVGEPYNTIGKIGTNGVYNAIAGVCSGGGCLSGEDADGEKAKSVALQPAGGIAIAPDGSIYFTSLDDVIRKIDSSGILSTVAGNWSPPEFQDNLDVSYDQVPAIGTTLSRPTGITLDSAGNIFFTESGRIQKIDTSGNIRRVAGHEWDTGYSGDGGPALLALLDPVRGYYPISALTISNNTLYFSDNNRFRMAGVSPSTIKGNVNNNTVFADKKGLGHVVNLDGRHEKTIDLQTGQALRTFSYDGEKLISISDQFGNETTVQYDTNGNPTSITSPYGLVTHLTLDPGRNLIKVTSPDTSHYDFTYSQDGLLLSKTEPNGNIYTHAYDVTGRLSTVEDEEGGIWTLTKTPMTDGAITNSTTTALGNRTVYTENRSSPGESVMEITSAAGDSSTVSWFDYGLTQKKDLASGMDHQVSYSRDSLYQKTTVTEVSSSTPAGLSMKTTSSNTYEDTDDDDSVDLFTETIIVNGKTATLQHNTRTSQKSSLSPAGRAITQTYDPVTLLLNRHHVPGISDVVYGYNSRGRLTTVNQGNRTTSLVYNNDGLLSSFTAPEGETVNRTYNAAGRLINLQRADLSNIEMSYDANGNVTGIKTPTGVDHTFSYTKTGKISEYTLPGSSGSKYTYNYDNERNLTSVTFPSGTQISNTYTNAQLSSTLLGAETISISYLGGNRIDTLTRGSETISYSYDGLLPLSIASSGTIAQTFAMTYSNDFLPVTVGYAGGTQNLTFDDDGLLVSSGDMDIVRDTDNGFPTQLDDGVFTLGISRNSFGEVSGESNSVNSVDIFSWAALRNKNGKITEKTEVLAGDSNIFKYTYDTLGRLTTVKSDDETTIESYAYDANGNRLSDLAEQSYSYDDQDRLLAIGGTTYSFNENGFLTSKISGSDTTTYNYSVRNELQSVILPSSTEITYTYDPKGRRIAKSVDSVVTEKYLWGGRTMLLAIYDDNDDLLVRYEYSNSRLPDSMTTAGGGQYYLHYDQVGSLKAVSNTTGIIVKEINYDSFGVVKSDSNPSFRSGLGFAGGLLDTHTKLLYFAYRDYNPETGRWNTKDPLLFNGGDSNLYAYVQNDPVNFTDRLGLSPKKEGSFSRETKMEPPTPRKKKDIRFNYNNFVKDMINRGASHFYDAADALAYATYTNDNSEDAEKNYKEALEKTRNLEDQSDAAVDVFEKGFGLLNMAGNLTVDGVAEGMSQAGKSLESIGNSFIDGLGL